jgi:hypothetical protein
MSNAFVEQTAATKACAQSLAAAPHMNETCLSNWEKAIIVFRKGKELP